MDNNDLSQARRGAHDQGDKSAQNKLSSAPLPSAAERLLCFPARKEFLFDFLAKESFGRL
jgi:hypothetical protein